MIVLISPLFIPNNLKETAHLQLENQTYKIEVLEHLKLCSELHEFHRKLNLCFQLPSNSRILQTSSTASKRTCLR